MINFIMRLCLLITIFVTIFVSSNEAQRRSPKLAGSASVNCSDINQVLDRCGAQASYSHTIKGSEYPTSIDELRAACPRQFEGLHCLRQHVRCLKPLTKRAILSFIETRKKHVKRLCSDINGTDARDFVDTFKCLRQHKHSKFVDSEILAIKRIDAILSEQVSDFKERFQRSCCSIADYRRRTLEDLQPQCNEPRFMAATELAIDSVVGEAVEFACPDARSQICQKLKPLQLSDDVSGRSLTRAGADLMIKLTTADDEDREDQSSRRHHLFHRNNTNSSRQQ